MQGCKEKKDETQHKDRNNAWCHAVHSISDPNHTCGAVVKYELGGCRGSVEEENQN